MSKAGTIQAVAAVNAKPTVCTDRRCGEQTVYFCSGIIIDFGFAVRDHNRVILPIPQLDLTCLVSALNPALMALEVAYRRHVVCQTPPL